MADASQPVGDILREIYEDRRLSHRKVAALTKAIDGKGLQPGTIGNIASGRDRGSAAALALIGAALGIDPRRFSEYQLSVMRASLDEREVGLPQAMANLRALGAPARRLVGAGVPAPQGEIGRRAGGSAPMPESQTRPRKRPAAGSGSGSPG